MSSVVIGVLSLAITALQGSSAPDPENQHVTATAPRVCASRAPAGAAGEAMPSGGGTSGARPVTTGSRSHGFDTSVGIAAPPDTLAGYTMTSLGWTRGPSMRM